MPAPIETNGRLCGMKRARSRASRGPIIHAATKPLVGGTVPEPDSATLTEEPLGETVPESWLSKSYCNGR